MEECERVRTYGEFSSDVMPTMFTLKIHIHTCTCTCNKNTKIIYIYMYMYAVANGIKLCMRKGLRIFLENCEKQAATWD